MFFGVKMDDLYDVIVIGAGNAGLCAAITTLDSGYKTLLVDRKYSYIHPCCTYPLTDIELEVPSAK